MAGDDLEVVYVGFKIVCRFLRDEAVAGAVRAVTTNFIFLIIFVRKC